MKFTTFKLLFILLLVQTTPVMANPGDVFVEILAAPAGSYNPQFPWLTPGHAFLCIEYDLNNGIKEDCYGFYQNPSPDAVYVGGSSLAGEFKQNPARFANVSWSLKKKITDSQRRALFDLINRADAKTYVLTEYNCGDFVHDAVDALGWPNVKKGLLPEPYVRDLVAANIKRFVFLLNGATWSLSRSGANWLQLNPSGRVTNTYIDRGHDNTNELMDDGSKGIVELQVPLHGGIALQRLYRRGNWGPYQQAPLKPEFE